MERANSFADFEIVGPDAGAVAAKLNLAAVKGRFAFDMPPDGDLITERVRAGCATRGWQASVRRIDRMPHRQRLLRLLHDDPNGVEVPFRGMWGDAVRGVPRDRALLIRGVRMDLNGPDAGRWHSVWVELTPDQPVASAEAGYVLVDEARLMFADPAALNSWRSDESADGLADLALWGRDAPAVAQQLDAAVIESPNGRDIFGWADRPVAELLELAHRLREVRQNPDLKFAMDFRRHDDHYRLLTTARVSRTESATIEVGGMDVTGFFTTWGAVPSLSSATSEPTGRPA